MEEDRLKNWFGGVSTCRLLNAPATAWWARDGAAFDRAIAEFAESYAEVNEEDHRSSGEAVRFGRVLAQADCERGTRPVLRLLPDGPAVRSVERELAHAIHGTVVGAGGDGGGQRARRQLDQVVLSVLGTLTVYWIAERYRSVRQGLRSALSGIVRPRLGCGVHDAVRPRARRLLVAYLDAGLGCSLTVGTMIVVVLQGYRTSTMSVLGGVVLDVVLAQPHAAIPASGPAGGPYRPAMTERIGSRHSGGSRI